MFEILNIGKYEREHYIGVNSDLREEEKQKCWKKGKGICQTHSFGI